MSVERPWNLAVRSVGAEEIEIAIYDVIGKTMFGEGIDAKDVFNRLRASPNAKRVVLRLNSVGGLVSEATAMHALLRERVSKGVDVVGIVDGLAASAGSYLLTACNSVSVSDAAWIMVHSARSGARGTASDMEAAGALLRRFDDQLASAYSAASNRRGVAKTKEDYLAEFAKGDLWLDAEAALAWGLADSKVEALKVAACLSDISELENAPAALRSANYVTASVPAARAPQFLNPSPRKSKMTKNEIQASFPAAFAEILADGSAAERRRVKAHLTMGSKSGAAAYALQQIEAGTSVTDEDVFAEYTSCAISARDHSDRQADSDLAGAIMAGAVTGNGAPAGAPGTAPVADGEDSDLLKRVANLYVTGKEA